MDNYSEQIVEKKIAPQKLMFIIFYLIFVVFFVVLTLYLSSFFDWLIPVALLVFGFGCYGAWYLIANRNIEYEYICVQGEMTVDKIIGKRKRKKMLKFDIKSIEEMGKWLEVSKNFDIKRFKDNVYHASIYESSELTYYVVMHDMVSKNHCLLFFSPNEKTLETMKPFLKREIKAKLFSKK